MFTRTLLAAALACALPALAQDGRSLAATCASCHGTDGRSATREVSALAGLPKSFIVEQMKAFRDGRRSATIMPQLAKGYSDAQIESIAEYLSAQRK